MTFGSHRILQYIFGARMRTTYWILIILVCFVSGGATCANRQTQLPFPQPPQVLSTTPSLAEVTQAVNRVSTIRQLGSNSVSVEVLSMKVPKLTNSTLSIQRDRDFRLKAGLALAMGAGVDLGSNAERFWFEVPETAMSRTLYFASHERFRQQITRSVLPVDPTWITDALGLAIIDPANVVAGPVRRPDNKLEIRSTITMPNGVYQQVYFVDPGGGFVTDIFLYAPNGNLIATSNASGHRFYEEHQCVLPHSVVLYLVPNQGPELKLKIDVGDYAVNQLLTGDPNVFKMPNGAQRKVDLTTLSGLGPAAIAPVGYTASQPAPNPIRGTTKRRRLFNR